LSSLLILGTLVETRLPYPIDYHIVSITFDLKCVGLGLVVYLGILTVLHILLRETGRHKCNLRADTDQDRFSHPGHKPARA